MTDETQDSTARPAGPSRDCVPLIRRWAQAVRQGDRAATIEQCLDRLDVLLAARAAEGAR